MSTGYFKKKEVIFLENQSGRKSGDREKEAEILMKKIAPTQKDFRSEKAKKGERISPTWMPDDIGTENFKKSSSTAYLRDMD